MPFSHMAPKYILAGLCEESAQWLITKDLQYAISWQNVWEVLSISQEKQLHCKFGIAVVPHITLKQHFLRSYWYEG